MPVALQEMINRFGGWPRIGLLLVGLGALGVIGAFGRWVTAPEWVVVSQGVDQVGQALQSLSEEGIEYRLERGGDVLKVRESDLARARVGLAEAGIPSEEGGFDLFDEDNWGITEFGERVKYRRALEAELARTISDLEGVQQTRVHLALEPRSFLRREAAQNEASVVLFLRRGYEPPADAVLGIAALVSGSVEHLANADVTVVDQTGRILSTDMAQGIGLSNQQLEVRQEMESHLQGKAMAILDDLVGPGNSRVSVSVDLDFDQIDRTVEDVDPDRQVVMREESSEVIPGAAEQGASQVDRATIYQVTTTREMLSRHGARINRLAVAVMVNDRTTADGDSVVTVARDPQEITNIENLVRNAVGVAEARGDEITVVGMPFEPLPAPAPEQGFDLIGLLGLLVKPLVGIVGLVLAFVLALRLMRNFKEMAPPAPVLELSGDSNLALAGVGAAGAVGEAIGPDGALVEGGDDVISMATRRPQQDERVAVVDPVMTARVVRAWLRE